MRHPEFNVEPIYKMSEALSNQLLSGHDERFVSEVENDCQCLICYFPLKEPVVTRCGHRFCKKKCLEENMRRYCGLNQSLGQFFAFFLEI